MRFYGRREDGEACAMWAEVQARAAKYRRFVLDVREYSEAAEISDRQMAYLHAVAFPALAKHWFCSEAKAERTCKERWCSKLYVKEGDVHLILSKTILTVKETGAWIDSIWEGACDEGVIIPPPDKDWKETERKLREARAPQASPQPTAAKEGATGGTDASHGPTDGDRGHGGPPVGVWGEENRLRPYGCTVCGCGYQVLPASGKCINMDKDGFQCRGPVVRR